MAYDVYTKTDADPSAGLTSAWLDSYHINLSELEDYYTGNHPQRMLTAKQALTYGRFWRVFNITGIVIDEPVGYLSQGRIHVEGTRDGEADEDLSEWATAYFNRRVRPHLDDLIRWQGLYGHAFLYFWTDHLGQSQGLKVRALPPIENGKARVLGDFGGEDEDELTGAVVYYSQPQPGARTTVDYRVTLTLAQILVERREGPGEPYKVVRDEKNDYGVLPLVTCWNPHPSDILHLIPVQDDINKLYFDWRLSREYQGFPMLSVEPTLSSNGIPASVGSVEVGPGKVIMNAKATRVEPGDLGQFRADREALLEDAQMLTNSLALMKRTGVQLSGVALEYLQTGLRNKLNAKANRLETALEAGLRTAARMIAADERLRDLEDATGLDLEGAEFDVTVEPRIPSDENANAERASILRNEVGASTETALGVAGVENPAREIERAAEEAAPEASE